MINGTLYLDRELQQVLVPEVLLTGNMAERMRGLLGRPALQKHQALLIAPCSSIHTFFMRYTLDLLFLDRHWQIRKLLPAVRPWRMAWSPGAAMVLEMPAESIENLPLTRGQQLYWKENPAT